MQVKRPAGSMGVGEGSKREKTNAYALALLRKSGEVYVAIAVGGWGYDFRNGGGGQKSWRPECKWSPRHCQDFDCGESRKCRDSKKGPCLMSEKPEGRFLTKKGSSPEWYKPKVGFWSGKKLT